MPTVADLIGATLARAGARTAFAAMTARGAAGEVGRCSPDRAAAGLIDALEGSGLRVVEVGRASSACAMAAVTGLLTDSPGVAVVALGGDGALREALTQAWRDQAPLVAITGGTLAIPEEGVVKASLIVTADAAAHWSAHACQLALAEPRGPVHLVVDGAAVSAPAIPLATSVRPAPVIADPAALDSAAELVAQAHRPVVVVGRQCSTPEVAMWLRALAESLPAPVLITARGKGALPDPHPLHLGLIDEASGRALLGRADLAVIVGVDPDELAPGVLSASLPRLRLVARPWAPGGDAPEKEVVGGVTALIEELGPRLRGRSRADWDVAELDRLKRSASAASADPSRASHLSVATAVRIAREATPAGTIAVVAADAAAETIVGLWQVVAPGELLMSSPPRCPGHALSAALAAYLARPQARVVCFASAGELLHAGPELELAVMLIAPLLVLLVDGADDEAADVLRHFASGGWMQARAREPVELGAAIERALAGRGPALIETRGGSGDAASRAER